MSEAATTLNSTDFETRESRIHGRGVFATRPYSEGEILLVIDDSFPVLDRGKLTAEQEIFIDMFYTFDGKLKTTWMQPPEKFINHSCEPNSYVWTDRRSGLRRTLALKNIRNGDELTWDYALNIWEEWIGPVPCNCGVQSCRRMIQGSFFTLPREFQRRYLRLLDGPFKRRFAKEIRSLHLAAEPPS